MKKPLVVFVVFAAVMAAGTLAAAQEKGQVGVNLGYPSLGVTWHVSDRVAVRPEFTFSFGSSSSSPGSGIEASDSDAWGVAFGGSALFYFADWEGVKGYVAPRLAALLSDTDRVGTTSDSTSASSSSGWDLGVMMGAQYSLNRRFGVFGEIGLAYSHRHSELELLDSVVMESDSWTLGPRTAIGMILYF
jgi:opacity protein-like surface antigen